MSTAWMTSTAGIEFALRGAGLLMVALLLCLLLKRAAPAVRHALLCATACGLLVLPVFSALLPAWEAPVLAPVETAQAPLARPTDATSATVPVDLPEVPSRAAAPPDASAETVVLAYEPDAREDAASAVLPPGHAQAIPAAAQPEATRFQASSGGRTPWLLLIWILGAVFVLLPTLIGHWRAACWARAGTPFPRAAEIVAPGLRVVTHPGVSSPMTLGLLRACILLPPEAGAWSDDRLRAVLLHEGAHAERRDVLSATVARFATALHWFNPLAWIAATRLRRESEFACDVRALRSGIAPHTFAQTLVDLARGPQPLRWHDAAATLGRSRLERRVDAILAVPVRRRPLSRVLSGIVLACAFLALAMLQPTARPAAADEGTNEAKEAPKEQPKAEKVVAAITVGSEGCDFQDLQAAVDAAPAKGHIHIAAGTYEGHVVIAKPLTLTGAGWSKTRLASAFVPATERGVRPRPTLSIRATKEVTLRGLSLTLRGESREGVSLYGAVLDIDGAGVRLLECAIIHSPASGIDIAGDANVEIRGCLVSSARSTGIAIHRSESGLPRVRIFESDIRYGHHRGITIGSGCNDVLIEGCRISGSAWHGIRYDDASPTIRNCRISHNVRTAIYASGRTRARVEGCCFSDTGMGAVSCWRQCEDTYVGNTFAHNARNGLAILGASSPTIERNVFFDNPVGVRWLSIGGSGPHKKSTGAGTVRGNVFWKNGEEASKPLPSSDGNRNEDPAFGEHYIMAPNSPVRRAGIGARALPAPRSPFPVQPEEAQSARLLKQHMERYGEWGRRANSAGSAGSSGSAGGTTTAKPTKRPPKTQPGERALTVGERSKVWIRDISASAGGPPREAALAAARKALQSTDPDLNHAGLLAILKTIRLRYDRDGLRELVLPLLERLEGGALVSAWYVLYNLGPEAGDLERLLEAAPSADKALRQSASHLIRMYTKGQLVGLAEAVVLALLADDDARIRREVLRGIWGAQVGPDLELRLIDLADTQDLSRLHDVVYFALSTLKGKSAAVVGALDKAVEANPRLLGRAAWGLGQGVSEDAQDAVSDFYAARIDDVTTASWLAAAYRTLGRYGSERHAVILDRIAADEARSEQARKLARNTAVRIRRR